MTVERRNLLLWSCSLNMRACCLWAPLGPIERGMDAGSVAEGSSLLALEKRTMKSAIGFILVVLFLELKWTRDSLAQRQVYNGPSIEECDILNSGQWLSCVNHNK